MNGLHIAIKTQEAEDNMKGLKLGLVILAAAMLTLALGGLAYAFHSGGVAECGGCHSMHSPAAGGSFLLKGTSKSGTCLACHEHLGDTGPSSYHISTAPGDMAAGVPPKQRTPGGDFGWLKKTYNFTVRGTAITEDGATHGHNIVADEFGYGADPTNATAPGGTFSSAQLACNSCHDAHGKYRRLTTGAIATAGAPIKASGSYTAASNEPDATGAVGVYRLLAGNGYANSASGVIGFTGVPAAKVPSSYNRSEVTAQTRAAYGHATANGHASWGAWCATCHTAMHSVGSNYVHKSDDQLGSTIAGIYTNYVKSGDVSGTFGAAGSGAAGPFSSLTPFIEGTDVYATLALHAKNDDTYLNGPASTDRVACLSCHRAHASGWEFGLRWNMEGEFMVYNSLYPGTDTTPLSPQFARGRVAAETQAAYYDRPVTAFATYQRVLCNKCHAQD